MTTTIPAGAKRPTDRRKSASTKTLTATAAEREWTVPTDALDDFELLDDLDEIENGNAARLPRALKRLLGDQYRDALDAIRDEGSGRVGVEAGADFVRELFESLPQGN